ncbi:MAG: uracil-DNA glycosylase [Flavobacteriales bacterium]|jgi:uracil-DNA glycosylase|nr:uracil-DNA glycosylase [Flavobacteriales bacterium]
MKKLNLQLNSDWKTFLKEEIKSDDFKKIISELSAERKHHTIFPENEMIFNAFNQTNIDELKVVILGQDPYHGKGQAHGLSFSVPEGVKTPPSLRNIFKELKSDLNLPISNNGNLSTWAEQGVLLLNSTLTVREKEAGSHQKIGWEIFTDSIIKKISDKKEGIIFLLWGAFAQKKSALIDKEKHHILTAAHPSPFSAYRGFLGCKHFSKTNKILINNNKQPINWKLCSEPLTLF